MVKLDNDIKARFQQALNEYFITNVADRVERLKKMCVEARSVLENSNTDKSDGRLKANIQLRELIDYQYDLKTPLGLREEFPSYHYALESIIINLPEVEEVTQSNDRYTALPEDNWVIICAKAIKQIGRGLDNLGNGVLNIFRKSKKPPENGTQEVHVRNIVRHYMAVQLSKRLAAILKRSEGQLLSKINETYLLADGLLHEKAHPLAQNGDRKNPEDFDFIITGFDHIINDIVDDARNEFHEIYKLLDITLERAGTLELNNSYFARDFTKVRAQKTSEAYKRQVRRFRRNHRIIKENWLLSHELNAFYEDLKLDSRKLCDRLNTKIHKHLFKQVDKIVAFLEESKAPFEEAFNHKDLLHEAVLKERTRINGSFKKELIPGCTRMMLFQNLPSVTLALKQDFDDSLQMVNTRTTVKRNFGVTDKLRERDLNLINPREIIEKLYFEEISKARGSLHDDLVGINNRIQPLLIEISNVHAYTFETARNNYETGTANLKETQKAIAEGFERTEGKIQELREKLIEAGDRANNNLDSSLENLAGNLRKLNSADSAIEMTIKLAELQARKKTQSYLREATHRLNRYVRQAVVQMVRWIRSLLRLYRKTEESLNNAPAQIDYSIKHYLSHAKTNIEKLPFIYRLLFRLEPLEDFNFYVKRNKGLNQLREAYSAWENGQYSTVLLIGSKGSGLTTLFNYFIQDHKEDIQINRLSPHKNISSSVELMELLKKVFNQTKFETVEDVGQYLVECGIKRIVLVDELQRFFLRKIQGFEILNELQKLIRVTRGSVFWVVNMSEMSSHYLRKTTRIHEFFSRSIAFAPPAENDIRELIMKRHEVSGFKLRFSDASVSNPKKFKKMSLVEKHEYLKNAFFSKLTKYSEGSFSLALLLWSLSAQLRDKQTIYVENLVPMKDILSGLDDMKVNILHALMLHDGLGVKELHEVLRYHPSLTRAHLASMEKDGIIESQNDFMKVNPLLHWSGIRALSKRNLIH